MESILHHVAGRNVSTEQQRSWSLPRHNILPPLYKGRKGRQWQCFRAEVSEKELNSQVPRRDASRFRQNKRFKVELQRITEENEGIGKKTARARAVRAAKLV